MKILIWGTGQLSLQTAEKIPEKDIVGYIDTYAEKKEFAKKPLYVPKEVADVEYDAILVSTLWGEEVAATCRELGIPLEKVIYVYGNAKIVDMNQDYEFVSRVCGEAFSDFIKKRYHLIREIEIDLNRKKKDFAIDNYSNEKYYRNDYVRLKTLELLVDELKRGNIAGQIAELGVFQGHFAKFLNAAFPDRKLYLFDTFEGFDDEELERELESDTVSVARDIYKNTSVQSVLERMEHKESIVIRQGFFPDSIGAGELEEEFALVSLDCDWEESLYQGLHYFYPRLTVGGYIMIHDYNNFLDCAKKAVHRYESDNRIRLPKVPICDAQGSLILTK
jgi:hypothetical protein